jgi:hypothetical protein
MACLHITCLELVEVGLGVVIIGPWLEHAGHVRLVSDAFAAASALRAWSPERGKAARDTKSDALAAAAHKFILAKPEWRALHEPNVRVDVAQAYGERLLLADAASRGKEDVIRDVCAAIRVVPKRINPLPQRARDYLKGVVKAALAVQQGDPQVDHGPYPFGVEAIEHMSRGGRQGVDDIFSSAVWPKRTG